MNPRIVLAAAHSRYDALEKSVREQDYCDVIRIRSRDELTLDFLRQVAPRYVFFPHWSWKIPSAVFQSFECVIFHMTDVPFGRGGSPLQNLIVRGFEQTQLSALRCVDVLDAGPVYGKRSLSLHGTAEQILVRASRLMVDMIREIVRDEPTPSPQRGVAVHFSRRTPQQSDLSVATDLRQVYDIIRMLDADGYPPAFIRIGKLRIEFTRAIRLADSVQAEVRINVVEEGGNHSE